MGDRALVAYEQAPDEYELHYSHWGADGRLVAQIGPDTPFADGGVEADPWEHAQHVSLDEILSEFDVFGAFQAFYIVTDDWAVSMWVPVEYGERNRGLLAPVRTYRDPETGQQQAANPAAQRAEIEAVWETAADLHDDHEAAVAYVEGALRSRYHGASGRGGQYDEPTLSSESPIPPQYQAGTMSISELAGGSR